MISNNRYNKPSRKKTQKIRNPACKEASRKALPSANGSGESSGLSKHQIQWIIEQRSQIQSGAGASAQPDENGLQIYCDSSVQSRSPGPTSFGIATYDQGQLSGLYYGGFSTEGTCDTGELDAIFFALELSKQRLLSSDRPSLITIWSNNQYAIKAISKCTSSLMVNTPYNSKKHQDRVYQCAEKLLEVLKICPTVSIVHLSKAECRAGNVIAEALADHGREHENRVVLTLPIYEYIRFGRRDSRIAVAIGELEARQWRGE